MINNISFLNFKSNLKSSNQNRANNNVLNFNVSAPKIAPLAKDTISFTSNNKTDLNKSLYEAFDNGLACQKVHDEASMAEKKLKKLLQGALSNLTSPKGNPNPTLPIQDIITRVKSPISIKEKVAGALEHAIVKDRTKIFNPTDPEDIKRIVVDIVGARIILQRSEHNQTAKIINALIKEVEAGRLKITKIESYEPQNPDNNGLKYFSEKDLKRLQAAANNNKKPGEPLTELCVERRRTGYMALHLDVDLSDRDLPTRYSGYKGEIQILGADVEKLKEVEDFAYKLRHGKTIKGGHSAYEPFAQYYAKFLNDENYPNLKEDIITYTSRAYLQQRKKEPFAKKGNNRFATLPSIAQCDMQGKIPTELDFNRLAAIKRASDTLYSELTTTRVF